MTVRSEPGETLAHLAGQGRVVAVKDHRLRAFGEIEPVKVLPDERGVGGDRRRVRSQTDGEPGASAGAASPAVTDDVPI